MKLYHAAVFTNGFRKGARPRSFYLQMNDLEREKINGIPNILESYHYVKKQSFVDDIRADGQRVFLDSGAFSADSLGVHIGVEDYCRYVQENSDILIDDGGTKMVAVLDSIGNPLETWRNQLRMEQLGVKPVPCYHYGEDIRYLEWYVQRYEYVSIGGLVRTPSHQVRPWLDELWNRYLIDGSGRPRLRVHAFGVTTRWIMERYPWHSVDSSSWLQYSVFGNIFVPRYGNISISSSSPQRHVDGKHATTLSELDTAALKHFITGRGYEFDRLQTRPATRASFNALSFIELNQQINARFNPADKRIGDYDSYAMQTLFHY